jgi:hypothetical protein
MAVATALTIGSLAATGATTANSFAQARKQRMLQQDAQRTAKEAMDAARKRLEVNVYEQSAIAKQPYLLEREALLRAGAQGMEAARESERGAAAAAGRIQMAQQEGQQQSRSNMESEIQTMRNKIMEEDQRLLDEGYQLNLEEVAGAQQAAADAQVARATAIGEGFEGVANLATGIGEALPLYMKQAPQRALTRAGRRAGGMENLRSKILDDQVLQQYAGLQNFDFSSIQDVSTPFFAEFLSSNLTPEQARALAFSQTNRGSRAYNTVGTPNRANGTGLPTVAYDPNAPIPTPVVPKTPTGNNYANPLSNRILGGSYLNYPFNTPSLQTSYLFRQ